MVAWDKAKGKQNTGQRREIERMTSVFKKHQKLRYQSINKTMFFVPICTYRNIHFLFSR